jgi:hypothetical protein
MRCDEGDAVTDEVTTMSLDDEMPWRPGFPADTESFYDDIGWSFVAETDELDLCIGNFIYNFQGGPAHPKSQFLCDGWVHNNLIIASPKNRRGEPLTDNNFHRTGMNPADFYGYDELEITRTGDTVTWKLGDIVYTCSPPNWHLGGSAGGVEFDVHLRQLPKPVVWSYGTREQATAQGIGGGYCYIEGEGTIKMGDRVLELRNISGVHERLVFTTGLDLIAQKGADTDPPGFGQGIAIHVLEGDVWIWGLGSVNELMFFVTVEGTPLTYMPHLDGSTIKYTPLDPWHDHRSGLLMPTRWQVVCDSADGRLELELAATARGYYPWDLKRGYQFMYWYLCMANGSFTYPDGRVVPIENRRGQHEVVRNLIVHQETLDGPILTVDG